MELKKDWKGDPIEQVLLAAENLFKLPTKEILKLLGMYQQNGENPTSFKSDQITIEAIYQDILNCEKLSEMIE